MTLPKLKAPAFAPPQTDPSARHRVLVSNGDVQVDVIVEGQGRLIVLLPSSQRDSEDFDDLADRLASAGCRVLRPQPRGMGNSRGPMEDLSLSSLASDVALAIRQQNTGPAVVVGHAFGHWIARVTDMTHPEWVRGIVVLGGAARTFPAGIAESLQTASDPEQSDQNRIAALQKGFFAKGNDPRVWLTGWHPALARVYRTAGQTPPKDQWFPRSHAPVLDLIGREDPWRPAATHDELQKILGDKVTVRVIEGASHAMIPEKPEAVAAEILGWIKSLPLPASQ